MEAWPKCGFTLWQDTGSTASLPMDAHPKAEISIIDQYACMSDDNRRFISLTLRLMASVSRLPSVRRPAGGQSSGHLASTKEVCCKDKPDSADTDTDHSRTPQIHRRSTARLPRRLTVTKRREEVCSRSLIMPRRRKTGQSRGFRRR